MAFRASFEAEISQAFSMEGRVAVVTGAASGLGREAARLFAEAGAKVVLADIDVAGLRSIANVIGDQGGVASIQPTDVGLREGVERLADRAVQEYGAIDAWINSAGIVLWASVIEAAQAQVEKIVAVNMLGTYWGCAAASRIMRTQARGGAIVNVSSVAGSTPVPSLSVYGMTKAAVEQLTRVAAVEAGSSGVRVNAVAPGWIDTPINASSYEDDDGQVDKGKRDEVFAQMAALSPLGLTGEPIDIGLALLYLASDASRFVTGQTLRVSGGA